MRHIALCPKYALAISNLCYWSNFRIETVARVDDAYTIYYEMVAIMSLKNGGLPTLAA